MIAALAIILSFQLVGEVMSRGLGLPLPGPVVGLVLLVAAFRASPALVAQVRPVAMGLLGNLSLFFVPAGVGVVAHLHLLAERGIALALALTVSTLLAMAAGAAAFVAVARLTGDSDDQ